MNKITDGVFAHNVVRNMSGNTCAGIYSSNLTRVTIECNVFHNLTAGRGSALMVEYGTEAVVVRNNLFYSNRASGDGYGTFVLYNFFQGTGENDIVQNNTFANNTADGASATNNDRIAGFNAGRKEMLNPLRVRNNLFAGQNRQVKDDAMERDGVLEYYCIFENNATPVQLLKTPAHGPVVTTEPRFADPSSPLGPDGLYMTADDGFRLQSTSACVNKGTSAGVTPTDITGAPRVQDGTVDIGCYESAGVVGLRHNQPMVVRAADIGRRGLKVGQKGVWVEDKSGAHSLMRIGLNGAQVGLPQ